MRAYPFDRSPPVRAKSEADLCSSKLLYVLPYAAFCSSSVPAFSPPCLEAKNRTLSDAILGTFD